MITVTHEGPVAHVRLNRPDKMNAVNPALLTELVSAGEALAKDDILRAVVLSGEGRAFCAGLDVMSFGAELATLDIMARTHGDANLFQRATLVWHDMPVPVIAALHGTCFGAGMQIASGADIRVAAPDTKLSIMEMKWGLVPDMGGLVTFPRLASMDVLARLFYTAEVFEGAAALGYGLVTECDADPLARALALASEIAGRSPSAVRAAKRLLQHDGARDALLMAESQEQRDLIGKPHQMEAVMANMAKRPPKFT
nr:crotonase/enoyl-CoA hydratase family protein [Rubricella aquisinus]